MRRLLLQDAYIILYNPFRPVRRNSSINTDGMECSNVRRCVLYFNGFCVTIKRAINLNSSYSAGRENIVRCHFPSRGGAVKTGGTVRLSVQSKSALAYLDTYSEL